MEISVWGEVYKKNHFQMAGQARQGERPSSILKGGKMRTRKETSNKDAVEGNKDLKLRKITKTWHVTVQPAVSCFKLS